MLIEAFLNWHCEMDQQVDSIEYPLIRSNMVLQRQFDKLQNVKSELPRSLTHKPMNVAIVDIIPFITVSDGFHMIEAIFTKESINDLRRSFGHGFTKLKEKVITVT